MFIQTGKIEKDLTDRPLLGCAIDKNKLEIEIKFKFPYKCPPYIHFCIERIDTGCFIEKSGFKQDEKNLLHTVTRYDVSLNNISGDGFKVNIETWANSAIYGFRIGWMAIGEKAPDSSTEDEDFKNLLLQYFLKEKSQVSN